MTRRQTRIPHRWLIADEGSEADLDGAIRALPGGSGVLVLFLERNSRERQKVLDAFGVWLPQKTSSSWTELPATLHASTTSKNCAALC
jgi:hypothetical protein